MLLYIPAVVVLSVFIILTVISVDDGLLKISSGCTNPSLSLTLYVDCLKNTTETITLKKTNQIYVYQYDANMT